METVSSQSQTAAQPQAGLQGPRGEEGARRLDVQEDEAEGERRSGPGDLLLAARPALLLLSGGPRGEGGSALRQSGRERLQCRPGEAAVVFLQAPVRQPEQAHAGSPGAVPPQELLSGVCVPGEVGRGIGRQQRQER